MIESQPGAARADASGIDLIACEMPGIADGGCPNAMEYAGTGGRKPKYCGQSVDGVAHTRYNAQRVREGKLRMPAPGSRPAGPDPAPARPVSYGRAGIEALRDEIAAKLTAHQDYLSDATSRLAELLATVTDPDAVTAEVDAAHREARTRIDAAESATADAQHRARDAEQATATATAAQQEAEQAAETALAERDDVTEERDWYVGILTDRDAELANTRTRLEQTELAHQQVLAERDQLTEQLDQTHTDRDRAAAELAQLREDHATLREQHHQVQAERDTARAELSDNRTELAAARAEAATQRQRAETAEHAGDELRAELADARTRADEHAAAAAEARTAHAVTAAENTALARQLERDLDNERRHGEQRLADLRERHADELRALRASVRVDASEAEHSGSPEDAATGAAPGAATRQRAADRSPKRARRRPGPEQTPDRQE